MKFVPQLTAAKFEPATGATEFAGAVIPLIVTKPGSSVEFGLCPPNPEKKVTVSNWTRPVTVTLYG